MLQQLYMHCIDTLENPRVFSGPAESFKTELKYYKYVRNYYSYYYSYYYSSLPV